MRGAALVTLVTKPVSRRTHAFIHTEAHGKTGRVSEYQSKQERTARARERDDDDDDDEGREHETNT